MTKEYFNTKEDYLLFRTQFAAAHNHQNAKPHLEPSDEWLSSTDEFSEGTGTHRVDGWMTATHYILLNILRGKPPKHGFTPITNSRKLKGVPDKWNGFNCGYNTLIRLSKIAKIVAENKTPAQKWQQNELYDFLKPMLESDNALAAKYEQAYGKHNPILERYVNILAKLQLDEQND